MPLRQSDRLGQKVHIAALYQKGRLGSSAQSRQGVEPRNARNRKVIQFG